MNERQYFVFEEHTLGYVTNDEPSRLFILNAFRWKGAPVGRGPVEIATTSALRAATKEDFAAYQVCLPQQFATAK